jgi:hypothetical protein
MKAARGGPRLGRTERLGIEDREHGTHAADSALGRGSIVDLRGAAARGTQRARSIDIRVIFAELVDEDAQKLTRVFSR